MPVTTLMALAAGLAILAAVGALYDRYRMARAFTFASRERQRSAAVLGTANDPWLHHDPATGWGGAPQLARLLGVPAEDVPTETRKHLPQMDALVGGKTAFECEVRLAGRDFLARGHVVPVEGGDHSVIWLQEFTAARSERHALIEERDAQVRRAAELADILDHAPFPIWRRDETLAIDWANRAYVEAVGASDADAVIRSQNEIAAAPMVKAIRDAAGRALETKERQREQHFVIMGDQRRALDIEAVPMSDGAHVINYGIDTTDFEEARAEIHRLVEAHQQTLDSMTTAVAIFAPNKTLDYYNRAYARLWRLSEEWLDTHPHHEDIMETAREARRLPEQVNFRTWKDERLAQYTSVIEPREEYWHLPDSRTLRVVVQPHPMGGLLKLYEDVTDRLALERSFNTLIAVQRETLNKLYEAVAVFSSDGHLRLFNPAYARIWNIDPQILESGPHVSTVLEQCQPLFRDAGEAQDLYRLIVGGVEHREAKSGRLHRPDRTVIDYTAVPLPDGGTLLTYLDVTDEFRIEQALRERNEALETADRLKSEFIAHVYYALRTPLNSIIGFTEILDQGFYGSLNEKQTEYVRDILRSSEQLRTLINDILDLAMIEAGAISVQAEAVSVRPMLEDVVRLATETVHRRPADIAVACPDNIGELRADRRRLTQVLYNLLSNAMKYTPSEGEITIGARRRSGHIDFFVEDTGVGITDEEQETIFQKFQTGSGNEYRGAGLGLALVRSFVELHGGSVNLESEADRGTCVTCSFPIDPLAGDLGNDRPEEGAADIGHASLSSGN